MALTTNAAPSEEAQRYTVLYYKRTNKVHKHRGTSRQDGILTIAPPPLCSVRLVDANDDALCDDDDDDDDQYKHAGKGRNNKKKKKKQQFSRPKSGGVIYTGVNSELAKRAGTIREDEEIVLSGQWECQIVAKLLRNDGHDNGGNNNSSSSRNFGSGGGCGMVQVGQKRGIMMNNKHDDAVKSYSKNPLLNKKQRGNHQPASSSLLSNNNVPSRGVRGALLHSVSNNHNDNGGGVQQKSTLLGGRRRGFKPPTSSISATVKSNASRCNGGIINNSSSAVVPVGKMKKDKNGEWYLEKSASLNDEKEEEALVNAVVKKTSIPSSLVRGASSTLGAGLMRKRPLLGGGGNSSSSGGGLLKRGGITQSRPMMKSSTVAKATTSALSTKTLPPNNIIFPGAKGDRINIPNSIQDVLRPHQREGIAFLWNCVTGVSDGLNEAIVRARRESSVGGSCTSSLSSLGSFDVDEDSDDDVEYDDFGVATSSSQYESGVKKMKSVDAALPRGVILADEMGLGKTLMTIATIFALHRRQRDRRFIVVCPSSLVSNWAKEFDKWIGKASQPKRVIVRNGNEEGLRKLRSFVPLKPNQSEVLILSYELFRLHVKVICNAAKICLLVVDEGHRLKNTAGSQTLSALNSITTDARILISGTVIQNNLSEFHTLASFAVPGILGDLNTFRRLYERPMSRANQKNATFEQKEKGRQQSRMLDSITSTFVLRRTQKDVLKSILPPRLEILLFCRPTKRQCQMYKSISNRASKSIGSIGGIDAENNPLILLTEARKLCTHPSLLGEVNDPSLDLSGKMVVLSSLLDSIRRNNPTDKVVIISNFTSALTVIEDSILRKKKLPFVRLDGSTDNASRGALVDAFNNRSIDHSFAFMLSSKAGGCGLNLIGANRLIMVDADWNPATDQQSMARIYRQGQTKPCYIYRLFTTGSVEEIIYQRQIQKENLAKLANDGGSKKASGRDASFTKEELRDCFTLKEGCKCDTKAKLGKKWSDYYGANSLRDGGFADGALLDVCEEETETLSFVHVVDESVDSAELEMVDDEKDDTKKPALNNVDDDDDSSLGLGPESSSEEEEFDG